MRKNLETRFPMSQWMGRRNNKWNVRSLHPPGLWWKDGAASTTQNTYKNKEFECRCVREIGIGGSTVRNDSVRFSFSRCSMLMWSKFDTVVFALEMVLDERHCISVFRGKNLEFITEPIGVHVKGQTIGHSHESCALSVNMTFALGASSWRLDSGF